MHRAQLAFNLLCEMGVWRDTTFPPQIPRGEWRLMESRGRVGEGSGSERDVRRRRREAVVISDGEGGIGGREVFMGDQEGRHGEGEDSNYGFMLQD